MSGSNTPIQSAPQSAIVIPPYRSEPLTPPPVRGGLCDWCEGPLKSHQKRTCCPECRKALLSFDTALGKRLAPWLRIAREQRPRTGRTAGPAYKDAQTQIRDITDSALSRLKDARRAAKANA